MNPSPHSAGTASAEIANASLSVLCQLEASLQASQKALLARDVAGIEQSTQQQARLVRTLAILWAEPAACVPDIAPDGMKLSCDPQLAAELHAAQRRVLHLARVQAGLLSRAQRWLTALAHYLAGPGAAYSPPPRVPYPLSPFLPSAPEDSACRA
jgi:hypothetical protein